MQSIQDRPVFAISGFFAFFGFGLIALLALGIGPKASVAISVILLPLLSGFTVLQPNEAKVLTFFGKYIGTIRQSGFLFTVPFSQRQTVPLKLMNFITDHLKVNDLHGNPIEIGGVVVWRVADAAQAAFNIDNYRSFVANQSDIAIRTLAAHYPYDSQSSTSLRGNLDEIADKLKEVLQTKLALAGIEIEETRLSHLAYASEVATAMLKRQQAVAIFEARQYMVENALTIIDDVIKHFEAKDSVAISDDKKAELITNLLVVMTSDKEASPVISMSGR